MSVNRRKAIRLKCLDCSGFSIRDARDCPLSDCQLHVFRMGTGKQDPKNRAKAIRDYCLKTCMVDQPGEVRLCPSTDCPLWQFRQFKRAYTSPSSDEKEKAMPQHGQGECAEFYELAEVPEFYELAEVAG